MPSTWTDYGTPAATTAADNWMQTTATTTTTEGTGYYNHALSAGQISSLYRTSYEIILPDPEVVRRTEPLEQWREHNRKRISERQKKEEIEASHFARRLLLEYLDEKNRKNFTDEKPIEVESGIHHGVKYHIPNYGGRIKAQRGDKVVSEMCLQVKADEWIPDEDKILTKLLYLRNDEATALRTANHSNIKENLLQGLS